MQLDLFSTLEARPPSTLEAEPPGALQRQSPSTLEPKGPSTEEPKAIEFVRHPRAKRYVITVNDSGAVRVTIPRRGSKREAAAFAEQERAWIDRQLAKNAELGTRNPEFGTQNENPEPGTRNPEPNPSLLERAKRELPARLLALAAEHGLSVTRVSVRNQRWRWGSCSRNGHICLNWRLVTMPESVRDYVMIHELMHLKRMDHSPRFWKLVARVCPDFQAARAWLRDHATFCHA